MRILTYGAIETGEPFIITANNAPGYQEKIGWITPLLYIYFYHHMLVSFPDYYLH